MNVSKGRESTEEDGTCDTATTTELTTVGKVSIGDNMQGSNQFSEGNEGEDTSGTVPYAPIQPKSQGSGHYKNSKSPVTNQSIPSQGTTSSSKKATFAELASKLPSKLPDKEIEGWTALVLLVFKVQKGEEPKQFLQKKWIRRLNSFRRWEKIQKRQLFR